MVAMVEVRRRPSDRALEELQAIAVRIKGTFAARYLWERVLTNPERKRLGDDLGRQYYALGPVEIWKRLRGVSSGRAMVDVAKQLGCIDQPRYRWLLEEIGEPLEGEEALRIAINGG